MKMEIMEKQALKSLSMLMSVLLRKLLAEKSVSQYTIDQVTDPIGKLDWEQKKKVADELITILETSKTEEEILRRTEEMYNNFTGGKEIRK